YWSNLPEARLIATLTREAPARVARMLAQLNKPAAEIPPELQSRVGTVSVPDRAPALVATSQPVTRTAAIASRADLDTAGVWDAEHDPGVGVARERARYVAITSETADEQPTSAYDLAVHDTAVRIGTASWTDPTILQPGIFYPAHVTTSEQRLQHYASRYSLVEVDSTYYVPPARSTAAIWAARTPQNFTFNVKAFALMTGHAAEIKRMPDWLRRMLPNSVRAAERVYAKDFHSAQLDKIWSRFVSALHPLQSAGKLGPILLQYPRWFIPSRANADALRAARKRLGTTAAAVEFRNPAWVTGRIAKRTLALLEGLQLTYVIVDAPSNTASSMPPDAHVTTPDFAMIRLHGRRAETWEARNAIVSERYRYLYDGRQLNDWASRIGEVAERLRLNFPDMAKARQGVHVVFNNCHANYGTTNADEITALLRKFDRQRRLI
ncbi:MAG: DUF72 domain-containing protein, partial [Gemmatimonadota bacterium]|nr:DUF72 domain-containing protein [Gemmatimonadota bacterium]